MLNLNSSSSSSSLAILLLLLIALVLFTENVTADFPVHCEYPQIKGQWKLYLSQFDYGREVVHTMCQHDSPFPSSKVPLARELNVMLSKDNAPNFVQDLDNKSNVGTWTLIYDQGFEIELGGYKYFAFFNFTQQGDTVTSNCYSTFTGWYSKKGVLSPRFGCFRAYQVKGDASVNKRHVYSTNAPLMASQKTTRFNHNDEAFINSINSLQSSWVAGPTNHIAPGATVDHVRKMSGAIVAHKFRRDARRRHMKMMKKFTAQTKAIHKPDLPKEFDWRNVDGKNYVSPVRNQGGCGSCYSFAFTGMMEARLRIQSKLSDNTIFSNQDIVDCSAYSQGCEGGFPYLISKYAQDFGIVAEQIYPYFGNESKCHSHDYASYARYQVADYYYVGPDGQKAYYGATTEEGMMINILKNGPIAVSFEVYRDFHSYTGGIYHHVTQTDLMTPEPHFVETNHVVVIVGWGEENGTKYWMVKNSWGQGWGINGYFKILRGVDECGIESLVPSATLVPNYQY